MLARERYLLYGLYGLLAASTAVLLLVTAALFIGTRGDEGSTPSPPMNPRMSAMSLTGFDRELAKQFMDKNGDGKCDACGMPVDMCIDSGQLQCNMDPASTIGVLGSAHVHADFKVFLQGQSVNFADSRYYMKSSFLHVDDNQNKEDASGVLHMHATGVPLWVFFKSIGMELQDTVRIYVNGNVNEELLEYVFNDGDALLLTDASDAETIKMQSGMVTRFAQNH